MDSLFDLQNEITGRIGNALSKQLAAIEADRPRERPEALDYIYRARAAMDTRGPVRDAFAEAIGLYERALLLDPRSVSAQTLLAQTLMGRVLEAMTDTRDADIERAERLIGQVLAEFPQDQRAHYAKGQMLRAQGRCEEASIEFEMVLAIKRNSAAALMHSGRCMISAGLLDEAILRTEQAIRLSPNDSFVGVWYSHIGLAYLLQSRPNEAILGWKNRAVPAQTAQLGISGSLLPMASKTTPSAPPPSLPKPAGSALMSMLPIRASRACGPAGIPCHQRSAPCTRRVLTPVYAKPAFREE